MDTCKIEGCDKPKEARGWCRMHYGRWYRWGDPLEPDHRGLREKPTCSIGGCDNEHSAKGLCKKHYVAQRRPGPATYTCANCGEEFRAKRRRTGDVAYCSRKCKSLARTPEQNRETALRSYYKTRYGLTVEEVAEMRAGGCQICGRRGSPGRWEGVQNLHVDHDHETGEVRGVLCHGCNLAIGHLPTRELLEAAIRYLK